MAPNQKVNKPLLEAVNLGKRVNLVKTIDDLMSVRTDYLNWRESTKELLNNSLSLSSDDKLFFFQNDRVQSDFMRNGGVGIDIHDERATAVMSIIENQLEKWISFLRGLNFNTMESPKYNAQKKILTVSGVDIVISERAESYQHNLLNTIFKKPDKTWYNDEILDDWYGESAVVNLRPEVMQAKNAKRIYQAGKNINRKVAENTGVSNFLCVTGKEIALSK